MTGRIFSLFPVQNFTPVTLSGHRNTVRGCYFEEKSLDTYTVSCDGALFCWKCNLHLEDVKLTESNPRQENEKSIEWKKYSRHYYNQDGSAELTTTAFHKPSHLLIAGFSTGVFTLHEVPDFILIHTLSISQQSIRTVAVNPSGEWLAFGCSNTGQLLVWEWQSETYILRQQGHYYSMNTLCYSQDGHYIATGGEDGKVKLWNVLSGFCFVTFSEHNSAVTSVVFTPNSQVVLSCSLDGTVRAFDLNRYRNFRTFASPQAVQFSCLSVDNSGEVVCAGSLDTFEIFLWCMKTGRLTEVLTGHEGPLSELVFSPTQPLLISGSWDKTVRLWNMFDSKMSWETLNLGSDVLAVSVRPDGAQVAVASLDCQVTFFDIRTGVQSGSVEGRKDLAYGRRASDKITAKTMGMAKCFTSLCYTADGKCLLAGGRSKFVCIYHVDQQMLLKRFEISGNLSLDGMKEFLHSGNMTEAGPMDLIDDNDDENDNNQPSLLKGDMSSRRSQSEVRVNSLQFSPTGQSWAAASTEGLLVYSLEYDIVFDPFQLDCDITPDKIWQVSSNKEHTKALVLSLRINEQELVCQVMEAVQPCDIPLVVQSLREPYTERLLQFIVLQLEKSRHLHFYLLWCHQLLTVHGQKLKLLASRLLVMLRSLQKSVTRQQQDLDKVCSSNTYALAYILAFAGILKADSNSSFSMEASSILSSSGNNLDIS
ncbi:periodic tryptophan protein 2 homolog isoform X4 [Oculina patagonica]